LKINPDIDLALIKLRAGRAGKDLDIDSGHRQLPNKLSLKFAEAKDRKDRDEFHTNGSNPLLTAFMAI